MNTSKTIKITELTELRSIQCGRHRNPNINIKEIIWLGNQLVQLLVSESHHGGHSLNTSFILERGKNICLKVLLRMYSLIFLQTCTASSLEPLDISLVVGRQVYPGAKITDPKPFSGFLSCLCKTNLVAFSFFTIINWSKLTFQFVV